MHAKSRSILSLSLLGATTAIFAAISARFLINPVHAAAAQGLALQTGFAITTVRVGLGVFPLGIALVTLASLVSPRLRVAGLRFVSILLTVALAVRIFSVFADHSNGNARLIVIEAVLLALSVIALLLEKNSASGTPPASLPRIS